MNNQHLSTYVLTHMNLLISTTTYPLDDMEGEEDDCYRDTGIFLLTLACMRSESYCS